MENNKNNKRPMKRIKNTPVELDKNQKPPVMGVGDILQKITNAVGISTCDECEKRKEALNNMFSFLKKTKRDLYQVEMEMLKQINATNKVENVGIFFKVYNEIFGVHSQPCQCAGVIKDMVFRLNKVMEKQLIVSDDIDSKEK